jgi:hypothetical protein
MLNSFDYKLENITKYAEMAIKDYNQGNRDNTLNNLRKVCEAICRAIILNRMGPIVGEQIILGEVDKNGHPKANVRQPLLAELIKIIDSKNWITKVIYYRLEDIRWGGNNASHDTIRENKEIKEDDVELCVNQYKHIINWFFKKFLEIAIPVDIHNFQKVSNFDANNNLSWTNFYNDCNHFSNYQRFVLVAPPSYEGVTENQLNLLSRIKWSMIFDFNPSSKETGLYKILSENQNNQQIRAITIEEKDKKERLVNTSHFALNYVFANGLSTLPGTVSTSIREWRSTLKYTSFIGRLVKEFLVEKIQSTIYIYLCDDKDYLQAIIRSVDENIPNSRLAKHIIVYHNSEKLARLEEEFKDYEVIFHNIPISVIIAGIEKSIPNNQILENKLKQIPARGNNENENDCFVDISNKYFSLLGKGVEVLHQSIAQESDSIGENQFYKGNIIHWKELAIDLDVQRSIITDLTNSTKKWLDSNKGGYVIELRHKPGSGGTTLARRIAFNFYQKYPTVIIHNYTRDKTNQALFELSEASKMPILAIVEAFLVTRNELNALIRKINEDKKHIVVLYVIRSVKNGYAGSDKNKTHILEDKTVDLIERDRFYSKYYPLAKPEAQLQLKKLKDKNPQSCEVIDFALTAYQDEYSPKKLEEYISNYLNKLPQSHIKFIGFASMIYYYTQISTVDLWFGSFFREGSLKDDYLKLGEDEKYILKLFINELDEEFQETNSWRPRFQLFASEMLRLTFCGINIENKGNWKDHLAKWSIELIKACRLNHSILSDDLRDLFKSLFLNRDNEDVLGIDENYETESVSNKKFSTIIRHIANKEQQLSVFQTLVDCYPDQSHLHGHLGRFLYEKATEVSDFEKAYEEINLAIELGENDYNMWHIKGMCNRRKIEFIIRSDTSNYSSEELFELEQIIQELTEVANEDFEKSRSINAYNLHSHTAQIQVLIQVIDFGRKISKVKSNDDFLTKIEYQWYDNELSNILNLIDEARYIIELARDLDQSIVIEKSKKMIKECEGKFYRLTGDYSKSVDRFKLLSESADRNMRPYYRRMFVYSTLASKVDNQFNQISEAWQKLSSHEFESLKKAIENNISEEPEKSNHIKLWLQAMRYSKKFVSLDECISTVKLWYENSGKFEIAHLEATYYLYVLYACKAISEGESVSDFTINEAKNYIRECKERKANDKFSFEWYGNGEGIKHLLNHSRLGKMNATTRFFDNISLLGRVEGTVISIVDRQKGRIRLKCGLDAFFVPSNGGFSKDFDETTEVIFFIGFRQDQLIAWEVKRKSGIIFQPKEVVDHEIEDYDEKPIMEDENLEDQNIIHESITDKVIDEPIIFSSKMRLDGPKIIGRIDLSEFEKFKKK